VESREGNVAPERRRRGFYCGVVQMGQPRGWAARELVEVVTYWIDALGNFSKNPN
jgi:hypothetical protein